MTISAEYDWVKSMSSQDLAFIKRFILASGSLKEMANLYGVSYPTIRLRLDRLIQKLLVLERKEDDIFEQELRLQFAEGRIGEEIFGRLLESYRRTKNTKEEQDDK